MNSQFEKKTFLCILIAFILVTFVACDDFTKDQHKDNSNKANNPNTTAVPKTSDNNESTDIYKSEKLEISITFPESWKGKYRIAEDEKGISVYFNPQQKIEEGTGLFFKLIDKLEVEDEGIYDSVGETRYFQSYGVTYLIGGPTDVNLPDDNPEFNTFLKMNKDRPEIIKTIKSLK